MREMMRNARWFNDQWYRLNGSTSLMITNWNVNHFVDDDDDDGVILINFSNVYFSLIMFFSISLEQINCSFLSCQWVTMFIGALIVYNWDYGLDNNLIPKRQVTLSLSLSLDYHWQA